MNQNEYSVLKQEILQILNSSSTRNSIVYSAIGALFAIVFSVNATILSEPLLFLLPFLVIIPMQYEQLSGRNEIFRLASYMITFLEGKDKDFLYETRMLNYREKYKDTHSFYKTPYMFLSFICLFIFSVFVLFFAKDVNGVIDFVMNVVTRVAAGLFISVWEIILWHKGKKSEAEQLNKYIKKWKDIESLQS